MKGTNRRIFLQAMGVGAAANLAAVSVRAGIGANETIRAAVLGVNGRGTAHISSLTSIKGAQVAVLCDPDANVLAKRAKEFEQRHESKVEIAEDMRRVFDRKDIDVITVATPNHWHSLAAIWACQHEKDVYVEKPGTHNIFEGRKLVEAADKYKRIVQHGVQLRSSPSIREAVDKLRAGEIGKVYMARGLCFRERNTISHAKDPDEVPKGLNWDIWQGPAQERAFSKRIVHYNWHWHWAYGNGDVGNQGVHQTDMCMWGLGVNKFPSEIAALGSEHIVFKDDKETPEVLTTLYRYPEENLLIQFEVRPWFTNSEMGARVGNIIYGTEGYMVIKGYDTYEIYKGKTKGDKPTFTKSDSDPLKKHFENFLEAVRSRNKDLLHGPVETAHLSSGLAHLGNISYRLGRVLHFDPATERFKNDAEADKMLTREYRKPYVVPDQV